LPSTVPEWVTRLGEVPPPQEGLDWAKAEMADGIVMDRGYMDRKYNDALGLPWERARAKPE
jgi:hypothetical protein